MAGQLDLIDPQKRLETFEKISSEGLLGVSKETIRGNEYYVFSESPDNLLGYYQLGLTHGEWTHSEWNAEWPKDWEGDVIMMNEYGEWLW